MSINVTVTGNPISIKRGKMVTSDSYQAKKDLEKRRIIRLQQVRQQSKEFAETVRNKVRKEKEKQIQQIQQEGKQKLKDWQNKKLSELKTEYEEALQALGTGHKQAMELDDEAEILTEQKAYNDKVANIRGQVAATKLHVEKNEENIKKAIPIQQKKLVRDIENTRASLVSNIKKSKDGNRECDIAKRKNATANISITIPSSSSDVSDEVKYNQDRISEMDEQEKTSSSSCNCVDLSDNPREAIHDGINENNIHSGSKAYRPLSPRVKDQPPAEGCVNFAKEINKRRKLIEEFQQKSRDIGPPLDTRISDRIKRRELMISQPDYCDIVAKTHPLAFIESNTQLRDAVDAHNINNVPVEINCICGHKCPKMCGKKRQDEDMEFYDSKLKINEDITREKQANLFPQKSQELIDQNEIPEKPPVKLKGSHDRRDTAPSKYTLESSDSQKVNFYDHPNRFSHDRISSHTHVERITADSIEVIPNVVSEREWHERMRQRDREAQLRGQKALEKERIQRDYEEMLKRLPLLQKKERICEIAKDKQEYHMSDERLKERERKKQNELDNAYSKLFPNLKPAVVTLPSRKPDNEVKKPITDEPIQSLNIGKWDVDHEEQKMFTAEEVQEIVKAFTKQNPKDRRSKLKQLLKSLRLQKEQLIREIKTLPSNDSINALISDLRSFSDSDEKTCSGGRKRDGKSERKRQREGQEKESSTDSTTESSSSSSKYEKGRKTKDKSRQHGTKTPSPRKKAKIKYKRKVLILQNTSTQTTPKVELQSRIESSQEKSKSDDVPVDKEKSICPKLHVPCDCNKGNESTDELCQIVIKINENEDPEVVVKSKEKDVKVPVYPAEERAPKEKSPKEKKVESKSIGVGTDELIDTSKREKIRSSAESDAIHRKHSGDSSKKSYVKKQGVDAKRDRIEPNISKGDTTDSKAKSWREHLSKNSVSTTSTSYLSPPDFKKTTSSQAHSSMNEQSKQSLYNLRKKPQQTNLRDPVSLSLSSSSQASLEQQMTDSRLVIYIQKLLSMSRGSIENLTASTSSVQTPSQSVIEMDSNNPLAQLHDVIRHLAVQGVHHNLSYSPDFSSIHYNTSASTSEVSPSQVNQENLGTDGVSKTSKTDQGSKVTVDRETSSCSARSKDSVLAQYADITDSCSKRIAQLASMIEQIRQEKLQMLQNPPAPESIDKDYSTAYLELPASNDSSSKYSSINSLEEEELQKKLLEIDFSLAEKLRQFSSRKTDDNRQLDEQGSSKDISDEGNAANTELWSRLQRLTHQNEGSSRTSNTIPPAPKDNLQFVPFLSDIPKLPKLEAQPENCKADLNSSSHKRPPPSKGLSIAKKFNGNISIVPHELSTIVEADSQLSTKIGSANNSRTSQDISPRKDFELIVPPEEISDDKTSYSKESLKSNKSSPSHLTKVSLTCKPVCDKECTDVCSQVVTAKLKSKTPPPSPKLNLSLDGSTPSMLVTSTSTMSKKSLQMTSSSSDDLETIESMLKSIGMEWAIPTLHKTKEALALTSSSSSLELSARKQGTTSGSEVSLRQYLKKQIKVSSSTLKSDASPMSFSGELSELSSIQVNNSNADKSTQKTSTPVVSSKSTERSERKVVFSGDSDISSVRNESEKYSDKSNKSIYRSLSEYSQSKSDI